jgi:hypothetical protein
VSSLTLTYFLVQAGLFGTSGKAATGNGEGLDILAVEVVLEQATKEIRTGINKAFLSILVLCFFLGCPANYPITSKLDRSELSIGPSKFCFHPLAFLLWYPSIPGVCL